LAKRRIIAAPDGQIDYITDQQVINSASAVRRAWPNAVPPDPA
jgi:hypothetical protein